MKNEKLELLNKRIEELEKTIFYLDMIDHWTNEDRELSNKYDKELRELKELVIQELTSTNNESEMK